MIPAGESFTLLQRLIHGLMAVMVVAMLFIGIGMVSTVQPQFLTLISIHKPLGIAILAIALLRLGVRLRRGAPPLPADLSWWQAAGAKASHVALYALMIVMPVVGWSMLSAGGYPVVLYGPTRLPRIMPRDASMYAVLRSLHASLAYGFFAAILMHVAAALFHGLIRRDGVLRSMAPWAGSAAMCRSTPRVIPDRMSHAPACTGTPRSAVPNEKAR